MGIAALVLGIISVIIGFIPFCGVIAFLPAIVGVILGIIDIVLKKKKQEKIGISIAGLVLSILAIIIISFWVFVIGTAVSETDVDELKNSIEKGLEESYNSTYYNSTYYDYDDDYDK